MKYQRVKQAVLQELAKPQPSFALSENQLAQRFAVSRMTARRALQELEREGLLSRQQGKGSFPVPKRFSQGFLRVRPFYRFAQSQGATPFTRLLAAEMRPTPPQVAQKLGVPEAVYLERLRYLDQEPVQHEARYLHPDLCQKVLQHDLTAESIHDILVQTLGLPLTEVWQRLEAVSLSPEVAVLLEQSPGAAALRLERLTYTAAQPVTWVEYLMRGDRYFLEDRFVPQGETP